MKKHLSYLSHWDFVFRRIPLLLLLLLAGSAAQAQSLVKGVVSDDKGLTLPGVSVTLKGSTKGVSTDFDGKFEINVPADASLTFSFVGFTSQTVSVNGKTTINIKLKQSSEDLNEVVVIGYGTQKRNDVNSAISSIKTKDLENLKQVSVDQMLQGKAAGVSVTNNSGQPGSAVSIRVRGTTSITGTNEPLYIIDGVPVSGDATGRSTSGRPVAGNDFSSNGGSGSNAVSPLSMINPNDIQSIDILKDASATAIYGSRGANGVIIITTKSGKSGNGKITYEGYTSTQTIYKELDVLNLQQYARYQNQLAVLYNPSALPSDVIRPEFAHPELLGNGTNWQKEIYRTAMAKSHQISFSGAKENTSYYLSAGFLDQEGIIIGSGYKRYTTRLNLDTKVKPWLRVGANLNAGISNETVTINQSYQGLISNTLLQAPDMAIRNPDGSFAAPPAGQNVNYFNPVAEALTKENKLVRKNFLGNIYAEANLFKGLKYRIEVSANTEFNENTEFAPSFDRGSQYNLTSDLAERRQNWYSTNIKNLLTYDFGINNHKFTILAGQEALDSHWEGMLATAEGLQTNDIYTLNLADPANRKVDYYKGSASIASLFGRIIYDYAGRYGISGSIRQDVSSKFDPAAEGQKQKGDFAAFTVSWKLSAESFMESTRKYIDNIKFRFGYGETGNQQIPNNRYSAILRQQNSGLGVGFLPSNFPNPDLTWESLEQKNLGMDFTLFNSRLAVNIDVYNKKSKGFLYQVPLAVYLTGDLPNEGGQYGGIAAPYSNLGEMQNEGYDLTFNYSTKGTGKFSWNSTLVVSHYKNELLSIQDGLPLTSAVNTNGYQPVDVTNTRVGNPIGMFYGYVTQGIFNNLAELNAAPLQFGQTIGTAPGQTYLGDIRYKDVNGDNVIDANDKTFIGNPHPDFTYGFTNNFKYGNFDLSVFLQGSQGNDVLNLTKRNGTSNSQLYTNQLVSAADFWTPTNTNAANPRPVNSTSTPNINISDRYIEDGSYLRIQNVTLGFSLPADLISKLKMSRVRLYASAQNLYTFTKYDGYDPEIGSFNQDPLLTGVDNGRYPTPRTYSVGVNVEF
ncbi:SusC/RagA family TonB-linked outer membrane protein [Flavobacterium noncentrifugens]|uniref:TonB-linked outer membrane protein, SusC/RagA family n=1 Tax=Flavobacterium noncentrifugens TaxID=1128970 RepID=A0A1G8WGG1_9FLAO|nr:TonB-dependent receptor [Flavobacterium noncentrifugens]GEP50924.1 SusC/RagA family TonB-linked outer membrane protein [Flavobacterium noncentrifugens]SDJ77429.1 TonB-linked outer membrane protein, SusC/RagA family [Flavobacterium noncentrifugens]